MDSETDEGFRIGDAIDSANLGCNEVGEGVLVVDPEDGDEIDPARNGMNFANPVDRSQFVGHSIYFVTLRVEEDDGSIHDVCRDVCVSCADNLFFRTNTPPSFSLQAPTSMSMSSDSDAPCVDGHYVYVVKCSDGTYYTGYTTNVKRRVEEHDEGMGAKYTRGRRPITLLHVESFETQSDAMQREYEIKQLQRAAKERLVRAESTTT